MKKKSTQLTFSLTMLIFFSFLISTLLVLVRFSAPFNWMVPNFVLLSLLYWILFTPQIIGVMTAWFVGLFLDILLGTPLGQYGLVFAVCAFMGLFLQKRFGVGYLWQQMPIVLLVVIVEKIVLLLITAWLKKSVPFSWFLLLSLPASLVCWPLWVGILSYFRNKLKLI